MMNGKYDVRYGKNCVNDFIDFMMSCEDVTFVRFNSANFDNYFLINGIYINSINRFFKLKKSKLKYMI